MSSVDKQSMAYAINPADSGRKTDKDYCNEQVYLLLYLSIELYTFKHGRTDSIVSIEDSDQ
jgi:hypothetical protein